MESRIFFAILFMCLFLTSGFAQKTIIKKETTKKNESGIIQKENTNPKIPNAKADAASGSVLLHQMQVEDVEVYAPGRKGTVKSAWVKLPGHSQSQIIEYEVIDGLAIFEGDIVLGDANQIGNNFRSAAASDTDILWQGGLIPFNIKSGEFNSSVTSQINQAINELGQETNLVFVQRTNETDYIEFVGSAGCSSPVGRQLGKQTIKIATNGGCPKGKIMHEILHSAGFWHEQSRDDRGQYIEILWNNIVDDKDHNFKKKGAEEYDLGVYDFGSMMHYPLTAFGKTKSDGSKKKTIRVLNPAAEKKWNIGQRKALSPQDIKNINLMYPSTIAYNPGDTRIIATVERLEALSGDECHSKMDFYGSIEIGDGAYWRSGDGDIKQDYKVHVGKDILNLNLVLVDYVPANQNLAQAVFEVFDMDTKPSSMHVRPGNPDLNPDCGGADDKVDINPMVNISRLRVLIDINKRKVYAINGNNTMGSFLGNVGTNITSSGDKSSIDVEKGKITYRIDIN